MVALLPVDAVVAVAAEVDLQVMGPPLVADDLIARADPVVHEAGDLIEGLAVKNPGGGLAHGGISIMHNQHRLEAWDGSLKTLSTQAQQIVQSAIAKLPSITHTNTTAPCRRKVFELLGVAPP